ncbi:metallophosphoesterase [Microvirga sp. 0TCS3.31]
MSNPVRPKKAKPSVCWYAPLQLLRTSQQVAIASVFGRHADPRLVEGITRDDSSQCEAQGITSFGAYDYSAQQAPFWIDYISDTGDGWDATYTVAYHAAQDKLTLTTSDMPGSATSGIQTERGSLLIFGGDEVYPAASLEAYETRLILPFEHAFPKRAATGSLRSSPHVFAVPGNHDWYDSLVSFTRLFCSRGSFAGWEAPQQRSYFALKLPKGWWLIGTDLQLGNDIDGPQHAFFERLEKQIGPEESILLCHAEPNWINEKIYPDEYAYRSIRELEALFGDRIKLFLAGDYHHYSRHENERGVQKIVAGGGGAFLHLTHGHDDSVLEGDDGKTRFLCRKKYPSRRHSWWLAWTNLFLFPIRNWPFGFATAPAYAVTASALITPDTQVNSAADLLPQVVQRLPWEPFSLFWLVAVATGVVFFTDTSKLWYRWTAGLIHAFSHIAAAVLLGGAIVAMLRAWLVEFGPEWLVWQPPLAALATAMAGYIVGPLDLALYLTLSLNVFRHHRDDASSALRSPHYKNFLRLCIAPSGELTIYPIGIRRVANKFGPSAGATPSRLKPLNGTRPFLIEDPIVIRSQQGSCSSRSAQQA